MKRNLLVLTGGLLFGVGLAWSCMARPEVVLRFLHFEDFGLLLVMGGAVLVALPAYQLIRRPLFAKQPDPFRAWLNPRTVTGSALFGIGWGLSGVCPGAAFASVGIGNHPILIAIAGMIAGALVEGLLPRRE